MNGKTIGGLAAMLALGAISFAVLAAVVQFRIGRPLASAGQTMLPRNASPLQGLEEGLRESLVIAQRAFQSNDRSRAVRALDAAMRAAEVGEHAAEGTNFTHFGAVREHVMQARLAVQNGNGQRAESLIGEAVASFSTQRGGESSRPGNNAGDPVTDVSGYREAVVINAHGVRIGEVRKAEGGRLVMSIQGYNDLLGFIDSGGQEIAVPADQVLFGKRKKLGSTIVAIPTASTAPDGIRTELIERLR